MGLCGHVAIINQCVLFVVRFIDYELAIPRVCTFNGFNHIAVLVVMSMWMNSLTVLRIMQFAARELAIMELLTVVMAPMVHMVTIMPTVSMMAVIGSAVGS